VLYVLGHGGFGGIERHVESLLRNLDCRAVEPHLCVVMEPGPISDRIADSGVPVHVIHAHNGHEARIIPAFRAILSAVRPDLIHAHELQAFVLAACWLHRDIPLVVSIHCALFHGSPNLWWSWLAGRTIERRVDYYLPVSQATWQAAQHYCGLAPERGTVFHNVIDLLELPVKRKDDVCQELGIAASTPLLGMAGRMVAQKDWPAFFATCAEISRLRPDAIFLAIGDGPLRATLAQDPQARALGDRLRWLGFREDARRLIGALDIFLCTSLHEELPTTLLEAFAMRTPVVGFLPRGGTREVLALSREPIAILSEDRDCQQAARHAVELLQNPPQVAALTSQAHTLVAQHFAAGTQVNRLCAIYQDVLARKSLRS